MTTEDKNINRIEPLLNLDDASKLTGFSKSKLYRDLRDGKISSFRLTKRGSHKFLASKLLEEFTDAK